MNQNLKIAIVSTLSLIILFIYMYSSQLIIALNTPNRTIKSHYELTAMDKAAIESCYYEEQLAKVPKDYQSICPLLKNHVAYLVANEHTKDMFNVYQFYYDRVDQVARLDSDYITRCFLHPVKSVDLECINISNIDNCTDASCGRVDVPDNYREQAKFERIKYLRFIKWCFHHSDSTPYDCKGVYLEAKISDLQKEQRPLYLDQAMKYLRLQEYANVTYVPMAPKKH